MFGIIGVFKADVIHDTLDSYRLAARERHVPPVVDLNSLTPLRLHLC